MAANWTPLSEEEKADLAEYWDAAIAEFEEVVLPVFEAHRLGRNTAFMAYMLDQLDSSIIAATARKREA